MFVPFGSSGMKTPSPRRSAEESCRNKVMLPAGVDTFETVRPVGVVASCCCSRPALKRKISPTVNELLAKLKFNVHSWSVGLLGFGLDGAAAGLLRVCVTSAELRPTESPKRKVEVKTSPGVKL